MIILASRSVVRVRALKEAGVSFDADAADLDEDALVKDVRDPTEQARLLARAKGKHVSARHPGKWVVGGDQVGFLDDGTALVKPRDPAHQVEILLSMAGRAHTFVPAVALIKDGVVVAEAHDRCCVFFRSFDRSTAQKYVESGEGSGSCGGYESEHKGAQLIDHVEGSLHALLGFPLFHVLALLRKHCPVEAGLI